MLAIFPFIDTTPPTSFGLYSFMSLFQAVAPSPVLAFRMIISPTLFSGIAKTNIKYNWVDIALSCSCIKSLSISAWSASICSKNVW